MTTMVFVISLFANNLFAQGAYLNVNAGYGLQMSSQNLYYFDFNNYTSGNNSTTHEQVNVSLGKGLNFGGAFGYMFNPNLGAEVGVSYLIGGKSNAVDMWSSGGRTEYTLSSKMLRINPSLVISSGLEKFNPYAKIGLLVGAGSIMYEMNDMDNGDVTMMKLKLNGGLALGLTSGIGAMLNISDKMSFFGELNMVNLSYAPTKGEIKEYTYNGKNELPQLTTNDREIEFVDSYTYISGNPTPDSQPSKELKQKMPFGSVGINLGVRINL